MIKEYERCLRCNRKLKTNSAKSLGYGKVCWEKFNADDGFQQLFKVGDDYAVKQFDDDIQTPGST